MTYDETKFDYCQNPEKIVDPQLCNSLIAFIAGHITDLEEQEYEQELIVDARLSKLINEVAVNKAEVMLKITDEYKELKKTKKELKRFRRFRDTLKGRFEVLLRTKSHIRGY